MEVRSEALHLRCDKLPAPVIPKTCLQVWFIRICSSILLWTCIVQLVAVGKLWHPQLLIDLFSQLSVFNYSHRKKEPPSISDPIMHRQLPPPSESAALSPHLPPPRIYRSNGYLTVSCNEGLNQMRAAICDMVTVARLLNLTMVVPELDKTSFWADPSNFSDIFNVNHFINSLRDEVKIMKRLPKRLGRNGAFKPLVMPPVSWSSEKYYWEQILPLFSKYSVIDFDKTDTRLANNGISTNLQKLRCRVNFQALKFTPQIEALGHKLIQFLLERGTFVALHLRYEMDMLAFSGCTQGCAEEEPEGASSKFFSSSKILSPVGRYIHFLHHCLGFYSQIHVLSSIQVCNLIIYF
ncbi:hypothetical protein NE237_026762 [Protea cynaroides]|uniref:O-fucosyltransferase family protein n=1 Tax=Protea cynaroides TaxID=273540 RepID=A0A9Q0GKH4_9MAGN|nr:hypothetical protein NE237_026762 [Protea cynaroides]